MAEEIESYLFIGGVVDGQWFNVPKTSRVWVVPVITEALKPSWITNPETIPDEVPFIEQRYYKTRIAEFQLNRLFVFVAEELHEDRFSYGDSSGWKIMCKLVNNYKVVK